MSTSTRRRGGLTNNPLDQLIPETPAAADQPDPETPAGPQAAVGATAPRKPVKFGGYIDPAISDQVRDAMVVLGPEWTLGEFMEQAFTLFIQAKADELNGGKPFPHAGAKNSAPGVESPDTTTLRRRKQVPMSTGNHIKKGGTSSDRCSSDPGRGRYHQSAESRHDQSDSRRTEPEQRTS